MMFKLLIIIAVSLSCISCSKIEIITNVLLVADWSQTRQITEGGYHEHNVFLGDFPTKKETDKYYGACILANTLIHRILEEKHLKYYQTGLIAVQIGTIANNYSIGLNVKMF